MFRKSKKLLFVLLSLGLFVVCFFATNQHTAKADKCGEGETINFGSAGNFNCGGEDFVYNPFATYNAPNFPVFKTKDGKQTIALKFGTDGKVYGYNDVGYSVPIVTRDQVYDSSPTINGTLSCSMAKTENCDVSPDWFPDNKPPHFDVMAQASKDNITKILTQLKKQATDEQTAAKADTCNDQNQAGPLSFILCPFFQMTQNAINKITGVTCTDINNKSSCTLDPNAPLTTLLIVRPLEFSGQGNQSSGASVPPLQAANARMRDIAYSIYIIIFLVIIFANFVDFGIDNYTIKRLLPRLVAAIVLTPFSYLICAFAIDLGNTLGFAVPQLITGGNTAAEPIRDALIAVAGLGGSSNVLNGLALLGAFLIVMALCIAVLISLIVALIYMLFRLMFLYILVIAAPLAIACSVLPLTNKFFRMWGTNLIKLNLMFPMVTGLIAVSGLISGILLASANGNQFMILAAGILPIMAFFLIPKTFKWSGELMEATAGAAAAYLGGRAGSYAKNAEAAHSEKERERRAANRQAIAAGRNRLYGGENSLARRVRAGSGFRKNKPSNVLDYRGKQQAALKPWLDAAGLASKEQLKKMLDSRNPLARRAALEAAGRRGMGADILNSRANNSKDIDFVKRLNPDALKKSLVGSDDWRKGGADREKYFKQLTFDKIADMSADEQRHVLIDNWDKLEPTVHAAAADTRNQGRLDPMAGSAAQSYHGGGPVVPPAGYEPDKNPFNR